MLHDRLIAGKFVNYPTIFKVKVIRVYESMKRCKVVKETDGVHNLWIVKPSYNARGFGIFCSRSI